MSLSKQQLLEAIASRDPCTKRDLRRKGLPEVLQADAEVVAAAVLRDATLFELFELALDDESLVLHAIESTPYPHRVLERASKRLRGERRVVETALRRRGKFYGPQIMAIVSAVNPGLGQDQALLGMAGISTTVDPFPAHGLLLYAVSLEPPQLDSQEPTALAKKFLEHLHAHPDVCNYRVFCCHSSPQAEMRKHLQPIAANAGVLVQLIEPQKTSAGHMEILVGPSQASEAIIARDLNMKIIRVSLAGNFFTLVLAAVDVALAKARAWRVNGCKDMALVHVTHRDVVASLGAAAFIPGDVVVEEKPLAPSGIVDKGWRPSARDSSPPVNEGNMNTP